MSYTEFHLIRSKMWKVRVEIRLHLVTTVWLSLCQFSRNSQSFNKFFEISSAKFYTNRKKTCKIRIKLMPSIFRGMHWLHSTLSNNSAINNNHLSLHDVPPTCFGLYMAIMRKVWTKEHNNGKFYWQLTEKFPRMTRTYSYGSLPATIYIHIKCKTSIWKVLYMLCIAHIYKLIRTNQQLRTKFTKLYLHWQYPHMFQWTCHHLQGIQSVTGAKSISKCKFFLHASNLVYNNNLRNEQHINVKLINSYLWQHPYDRACATPTLPIAPQ
jgi:hypothetical protein